MRKPSELNLRLANYRLVKTAFDLGYEVHIEQDQLQNVGAGEEVLIGVRFHDPQSERQTDFWLLTRVGRNVRYESGHDFTGGSIKDIASVTEFEDALTQHRNEDLL